MLADYLAKIDIPTTTRQYNDKLKYNISYTEKLGTKVSDIIKNVKEMQKYIDNNEYAIIPVAKTPHLVIEIVADSDKITWRITKGTSYIDIDSKEEAEELEKVLAKLKTTL